MLGSEDSGKRGCWRQRMVGTEDAGDRMLETEDNREGGYWGRRMLGMENAGDR